jgi:RNA polymerase sigma factor (sigma-70 family)
VVHVVDDDASWRTSVQRLMSAVGYDVVLYESAERFLEDAKVDAPGCVLLDVRMPGLSGLQLQERLTAMRPSLTVIFVSGHGDIPTSVLAMKAGAEDFLTKPVDTDVLLRTVGRAVERDRAERDRRAQLDVLRGRLETLTPSERKVFDLVVRGKLNKQIAAELGVSENTIKAHRRHIMKKMGAANFAELMLMIERLL